MTMKYAIGDIIEYKDYPGYRMKVIDVEPCDHDAAQSKPHWQYCITDPTGDNDWVCARDVTRVGGSDD